MSTDQGDEYAVAIGIPFRRKCTIEMVVAGDTAAGFAVNVSGRVVVVPPVAGADIETVGTDGT